MTVEDIIRSFGDKTPDEVAEVLREAVVRVLPDLTDEARRRFYLGMSDTDGADKVSSLVHL